MSSGRGSYPSAPQAGSIPVFMVRMEKRKVVEEKGIARLRLGGHAIALGGAASG